MPTSDERADILRAHARKLHVSSAVDFDALAARTAGFSGADLQALVYGAHLEVVHADMRVHASLAEPSEGRDEQRVEFVAFGGPAGEPAVRSRAEEMALQRRVRAPRVCCDRRCGVDCSTIAVADPPADGRRGERCKRSEGKGCTSR
jgi:peroxin-1